MAPSVLASHRSQAEACAELRREAESLWDKAQAARPDLGGPMTLPEALERAEQIQAVRASTAWAAYEDLMRQWQEAVRAAEQATRALRTRSLRIRVRVRAS
jgi:hypothetical protein